MAAFIETLIGESISVITNDGRNLMGTLKGYDQHTNLILSDAHERVFSQSAGVNCVVLGLYIIRGENIALIGEVDEKKDADFQKQLGQIRAAPLNPVRH